MPAQTDSLTIPYVVSHRDIKHPRLEFRTGTLLVVLPLGQDERRILEKHRLWIERKYRYILEAMAETSLQKVEFRTPDEFRVLVNHLVESYSSEIGCVPNRIVIKRMRTKWASCSKRGNLTINYKVKYLPEPFIRYILFHEMVHMINPKHDTLFWKYIEAKFKDIQEIEKNLCSYWYQIERVPVLLESGHHHHPPDVL